MKDSICMVRPPVDTVDLLLARSAGSRPGDFSCSDLRCKTKLVDHPLAHDELLDLAHDCHWARIDEANVSRYLIVRDPVLTEFLDLLLAYLHARSNLHPCAEHFSQSWIRYTEACHRLDHGVSEEELLDLPRINVLSAPNDHVLDPADDVAVS